jgi:murein DD-endopeptidase MepM/ murein hydrolase activator NlpD
MFEKINFKHRHILTPSGAIRLKFIIGLVLAIGVLSFFIFGGGEDEVQIAEVEKPVQTTVVETAREPDPIKKIEWGDYDPEVEGQGVTPFLSRIGARPYFDKPYTWTKAITVKSGDVLGTLMEDTGLSGDDYIAATRAIKTELDPQDIRPGHKINVIRERLGEADTIQSVAYIFDSLTSVAVTRNDEGTWGAETKTKPLDIKKYAIKTTIENSIYGSMGKAGVPDGIINRMITAYSWTVDFQRDIWGGEEVEVLFETRETADGEYVRSNRLLYANLKLRNKEMPIYLFEKDKGFPNYFEPDGQSIRRALMRTPVDGARLSSGYGPRKHPVLGYNKMHKGLDFAAPIGTPIFAAGDGIVERANRFGAYGNYMRIRHNETYKTAYAHISKFAKGVRKGSRVKQGQVIAYIGNTGRSTGPHLHYEVIKNGKQVNPHSVDLPLGEKLRGQHLINFKDVMSKRDVLFRDLLE